MCLTQETKEDRQREVDPKLLFPLKAWLRGFLPGHKFTWEEETDVSNEYENEMKVKLYFTVRANNFKPFKPLREYGGGGGGGGGAREARLERV